MYRKNSKTRKRSNNLKYGGFKFPSLFTSKKKVTTAKDTAWQTLKLKRQTFLKKSIKKQKKAKKALTLMPVCRILYCN